MLTSISKNLGQYVIIDTEAACSSGSLKMGGWLEETVTEGEQAAVGMSFTFRVFLQAKQKSQKVARF